MQNSKSSMTSLIRQSCLTVHPDTEGKKLEFLKIQDSKKLNIIIFKLLSVGIKYNFLNLKDPRDICGIFYL